MENQVIIIRTGYKYRGENWDSFINGYFENVYYAEKYLESNGYEFSHDDVYMKIDEEEIRRLARIETLDKITV